MIKIYMAAPLFSEPEVNQRILEYNSIMRVIKENRFKHEVFAPINAPHNDKSKLQSSENIFVVDEEYLMPADVVFADITGEDAGVMMELGMVIRSGVKIYPYLTDIRLQTAGEYDKHYVPFGYNQFVIGGLERYGHKIHYSFKEALDSYVKDFS